MKKVLLTIAALGAATTGIMGGATIAAAARGGEKIAMQSVGAPVDCVQLRNIRSTKIIDNQTIDFKMAGGKTLRNTLPYSCPSLKSEDAFSYHTSLSQLCSVDTIRVLQNFGGRLQEGAGCGLGKFQQVQPAQGG